MISFIIMAGLAAALAQTKGAEKAPRKAKAPRAPKPAKVAAPKAKRAAKGDSGVLTEQIGNLLRIHGHALAVSEISASLGADLDVHGDGR